MTHASLFSGIGGFDLAARWVGWENLFNCEIDPFCQTVLKYHFPDAEQYSDIRATDFTLWRGLIDVLSGGFPCQPFSVAGKRKGTEDKRHLWPEMLRAIREIQPRWVVGENVLGIVSWSGGLVFEQVCSDLEAEGYQVQTYVLPACGVGAPHRRYRTWFVAHTKGERGKRRAERNRRTPLNGIIGCNGITAHTHHQRPEQQPRNTIADRQEQSSRIYAPTGFNSFPTQSPVCSRDDGFSARLDGITFPKWRAESIKAYGNAIVPQVVLQIFETINDIEIRPR